MTRYFSLQSEPVNASRATVQAVASGVVAQLFLLISGPLVARLLGVVDRGYLAGLMAWPSFIVPLGTLGVGSACTYYLSRGTNDSPKILGEVYRIAILQVVFLTAVVAVVLVAWTRGKPLEVRLAALPVLVAVPGWLLHQYSLAALQGFREFGRFNVLRVLPAALYALGAVVLFVLRVDKIIAIVVVAVCSAALPAAIATRLVVSTVRPSWKRAPAFRRRLISFGLRGHLGALSPVDGLRIDQVVGALLLSPADLGLYAVAAAFCNLPRIVAESAGKVMYPLLAQRSGGAPRSRLLWGIFGGVTALNLMSSAVLFVAMSFLIRLFFGEQFSGATPVARVLLVGTTLVASRRILADALRGLGKPGISTLTEISMYPWLLAGAPILIGSMGVMGLAVALTVGYGLSLVAAIGATIRFTRSEMVP